MNYHGGAFISGQVWQQDNTGYMYGEILRDDMYTDAENAKCGNYWFSASAGVGTSHYEWWHHTAQHTYDHGPDSPYYGGYTVSSCDTDHAGSSYEDEYYWDPGGYAKAVVVSDDAEGGASTTYYMYTNDFGN